MLFHNKKSRYTSESFTSSQVPVLTWFLPLTDHGRCVIVVIPWTRTAQQSDGGLCNTIGANDKTSERSCKEEAAVDQSNTIEDNDLERYPGLLLCVFRSTASIALYTCFISPRK